MRKRLTLGGLELLSLLGAADTAVEAAEGDALLLLNNVAEVSVSLLELHAVDGSSGLAGVLEVNTEVLAARLGGLLHEVGVVESVSDLLTVKRAKSKVVDGKNMYRERSMHGNARGRSGDDQQSSNRRGRNVLDVDGAECPRCGKHLLD